MKNPPHPGRSIRDACLDPLKPTIAEGARLLGVTRNALTHVINGHAGISPEMAIRLEKMGWSADSWLAMQTPCDLARARKAQHKIRVTPYQPVSA